ncbi:MAG TPA: hypothetical protein VFE06_07165 [Acidobacteriaceae bacterium]|nr:hypothetical protein [Acidobacteriaceae bacterium]
MQRVLEFRQTQFQLAESEFQHAAAKVRSLQAQQAALIARKWETRRTIASLPQVKGGHLAPLPGWYQWTVRAADQLSALEREATADLQKRRQAMVEAHRQVRLLEKLRDKRRGEWQAAFDRELEELAADSTNSRFSRAWFPESRLHD